MNMSSISSVGGQSSAMQYTQQSSGGKGASAPEATKAAQEAKAAQAESAKKADASRNQNAQVSAAKQAASSVAKSSGAANSTISVFAWQKNSQVYTNKARFQRGFILYILFFKFTLIYNRTSFAFRSSCGTSISSK